MFSDLTAVSLVISFFRRSRKMGKQTVNLDCNSDPKWHRMVPLCGNYYIVKLRYIQCTSHESILTCTWWPFLWPPGRCRLPSGATEWSRRYPLSEAGSHRHPHRHLVVHLGQNGEWHWIDITLATLEGKTLDYCIMYWPRGLIISTIFFRTERASEIIL